MSRLLIVDDNMDFRVSLEKILKLHGHHVMTAVNGADALEMASHTPPDLVISDILMPVMDGYKLCSKWKEDEQLKEIPFVFFTATYTLKEDADAAFELGADEFLTKTIGPEAFIKALQPVLDNTKKRKTRARKTLPESKKNSSISYNKSIAKKLEKKTHSLELEAVERKKTEKALLSSETKYRMLVETMNDGFGIVDNSGVITYANNKLCEMFEYSRDEMIGQPATFLFDKENTEKFAEQMKKMGKKSAEHYEIVYTGKYGKKVNAIVSPQILFDTNGNRIGSFAVITDITDQKKIEKELFKHRTHLKALVEERSSELLKVNAALQKEVNERKEAEQELNKFKFVSDNSTDANFLIGRDAQFLYVNKAACKMFSYTKEELLKLRIPDIDIRYGLEQFQELFNLIQTKHVPVVETVNKRKDGSTFPSEITVTGHRMSGKPYMFASLRDVTRRKLIEETSRHMALFAELNPSPVLRFNRNGDILMANPAAIEVFRTDSLTGVPLHSILSGIEEIDYASCINNGSIFSHTINIEGHVFYFTFKGIPELEIGQIYGDNVTELMKTKSALEKSEERHRRITETITDYIYTVYLDNNQSVKTEHSETCEAVTGYTKEEFSSMPSLWLNMVVKEDRQIVLMQAQAVISGAFPQSIEHRIIRKDGEIRWVESNVVPNLDTTGTTISYDGVVRDITDRKNIEQQLFHAQKMESVGQLAGGIAHDFNNILMAMQGDIYLLTRKMNNLDPLRTYVDDINNLIKNAASLTTSLLAFSRKQVINPLPVNLTELAIKVINLMKRIIAEDISIKTEFSDSDVTVMADAGQIEQVIINLINNATDAMPDGGILTIGTELKNMGNHFIKDHNYDNAEIWITDTGIGMNKQTREQVFEPFFTTKAVGKGTGLGLSMAYGIIKQHNGYIICESEAGKGTTFKLFIPVTKEITGNFQRNEISTVVSGNETILLAEDNSNVRKIIITCFNELGYNIIEAIDGEDAINKFMENKQNINLLILDIVMPRKNGLEAYESISRHRPGIPTLFISGHDENLISKKGLYKENIDYISKPINPENLMAKARNILMRQENPS